MSDFKIDKDVPIPRAATGDTRSRGNQTMVYPWRVMNVGDSFFVADDGKPNLQTRMAVLAHSYRTRGHGLGKQFVTRKENDGVRIWRVK